MHEKAVGSHHFAGPGVLMLADIVVYTVKVGYLCELKCVSIQGRTQEA